MKARILISAFLLLLTVGVSGQGKPSIALISIDSKGIELNDEAMANLVRLELSKIDHYEVLDKYDVADIISEHGIDPASTYGKTGALQVGHLLKVDKILTGSVERIAEKIVIILRVIDVGSESIEKTRVMEFLNTQEEIQNMVMITINELMGIPNDPHLVEMLIDYNVPVKSAKTNINLNGPRMGVIYYSGTTGDRLTDSKVNGGYDMFPVASMFGYQFEKQYLSAGNFQALVEAVVSLNGLETGKFIPSVAFLNGFRFYESGFEFGLGPVLRVSKRAMGYFDNDGNWHLDNGDPSNYELIEAVDSRGEFKPALSMIIAVGKTFRSGYLNVPLNVYFSPSKSGHVFGITFGFNTQTKAPN